MCRSYVTDKPMWLASEQFIIKFVACQRCVCFCNNGSSALSFRKQDVRGRLNAASCQSARKYVQFFNDGASLEVVLAELLA